MAENWQGLRHAILTDNVLKFEHFRNEATNAAVLVAQRKTIIRIRKRR